MRPAISASSWFYCTKTLQLYLLYENLTTIFIVRKPYNYIYCTKTIQLYLLYENLTTIFIVRKPYNYIYCTKTLQLYLLYENLTTIFIHFFFEHVFISLIGFIYFFPTAV